MKIKKHINSINKITIEFIYDENKKQSKGAIEEVFEIICKFGCESDRIKPVHKTYKIHEYKIPKNKEL